MKLNLRERFSVLCTGVQTTLRRHPLELALLLALTMLLIFSSGSTNKTETSRWILLGWGASLLLIVNRLLPDTGKWRRIYWVAWVLLVPFFFWRGFPDWIASAQGVVTMLVLTPLALLACRRAVTNERFVADSLVYLRSGVLAMLFPYVAYGLFEAIFLSAAYIFGFSEFSWVKELSVDLLYVVQFFVVPTLFMMLVDRWDGQRVGSSPVLATLVNWVVTPAVVAYAAVLYLYLLKIIVTWSLPDGGVAYLVFGFTLVALAVKLLRIALVKRTLDWFYDRFSLVSLPLVALFWVGVARRIGEYGLTEARVYLLVCGAVMSFCIVLFLSRRAGRYLWVVLFAMLSFAAVTYVPALHPERVELRSQTRRAMRLAADLGRLDAAGRLSLAPFDLADTVRYAEYRSLYSALSAVYVCDERVLSDRFGIDSPSDLVDILPSGLQSYVRYGWEITGENEGTVSRRIWVDLPELVMIDLADSGPYRQCYVNFDNYESGSERGYALRNDTLRFSLPGVPEAWQFPLDELLERQLRASGYNPSLGEDPTDEQSLRLLEYSDEYGMILFERFLIEHRDSVNTLDQVQVRSLWLR